MTLVTRFWLSGALFPLLVMALVLFGADRLFHLALERSLDRALLAQAAVESVSLFDGPQGKPHLHMSTSPLVDSVKPFAPVGYLYGPDGLLVMRYPPDAARVVERVRPAHPAGTRPALSTRNLHGQHARVLDVVVDSPDGQPYTLRLVVGRAQLDAAVETFRGLALLALLVTALLLLSVQIWLGRSLRRRLSALTAHGEALRAGDLSRALPVERERDELRALRDVLSDATEALRVARDARERFIADAAHELRTPLTLMRTSLDLALRRERSPEELKDALSDTREQVVRLSNLATRLLELAASHHRAEPLEDVDLSELLRDAADAARDDAASRGLSLEVEASASHIARVRPEAVRRAVDNLLSNALKYAQTKVVLALEEGTPLRLSVRDDGPGIPESEREAVFEPFHRVRGSVMGFGLGLALVKDVALSHGGRAYVRGSKVGTSVVVELS